MLNKMRTNPIPAAKALTAVCIFCFVLCLCGGAGPAGQTYAQENDIEDYSGYLSIVADEPDTVDFQCTTEYYDVALNVFDRLVEVEALDDGTTRIIPSLADSWTVSEDGLVYEFHLHEGVLFSNGEELTSDDVQYTFNRLLTYPNAVNHDLLKTVKGAMSLISKNDSSLSGFQIIDDYTFRVTLEYPDNSFLGRLAAPGASIMDKASAKTAGNLFGNSKEWTFGTGPFIIKEWEPGAGMILQANPDCWSGAPSCDGVYIHFIPDDELQRAMFDRGELDILNLDSTGSETEYIIRGDIYQDNLVCKPRIGITFIALNEHEAPLNNEDIRKALTLALDRQSLLDVAYSGRGQLENGIYPHGLKGFDPDLPAIPFDTDQTRELLREWRHNAIEITISVEKNATENVRELVRLVSYMWSQSRVTCQIEELDSTEFNRLRKNGELSCYIGTWTADYDDPDNFIYTFFGSPENTMQQSLGYPDTDVMRRICEAGAIADEEESIAEYQALEKQIVHENAAWIPLFSRMHYFLVSDRVEGFRIYWNGGSSNQYRNVSVSDS